MVGSPIFPSAKLHRLDNMRMTTDDQIDPLLHQPSGQFALSARRHLLIFHPPMHIGNDKVRIEKLGFSDISFHYFLIDIIDNSGCIDLQTVGVVSIIKHDDTKVLFAKQHRICAATVVTVKKGSSMTDFKRIQRLDGADKSASPPV